MNGRDQAEALRRRLRGAKADEIRSWKRASGAPGAVGGNRPAQTGASRKGSLHLKAELQARLLDDIARRGLLAADDDEIAEAVEDFVRPLLEEEARSPERRRAPPAGGGAGRGDHRRGGRWLR